MITVLKGNLQCSLADIRLDSTYMGQLSLPSFLSCAITCYAKAFSMSIDPNAIRKTFNSHSWK